jgi:hypothetical protein
LFIARSDRRRRASAFAALISRKRRGVARVY